MTQAMNPVKETNAQRAERLKREKNPWAAFDEVRAFARRAAPASCLNGPTYFKWWGIYTQGDGVGATGGKGGEGVTTDYFMMRIGIPNGIVCAQPASRHWRADAQVRAQSGRHYGAPEHSASLADHRVAARNCGCAGRHRPLAQRRLRRRGAQRDRLPAGRRGRGRADRRFAAGAEIAHLLSGNPEFYNLPRKFKISATGCPSWCSYPEINDIALTAAKHEGQVGYSLRVGGGLSNEPHLAVRLDAFVLPEQAPRVAAPSRKSSAISRACAKTATGRA